MARLIAQSRIDASGLYWCGPVGESRLAWRDVDPAVSSMPPLRARYFFNEAFPKFGRMDPLCKIAVAATQLIRKAGGFDGLNLDEVAQVGGTTAGCLEADALFEASRIAGSPSPALFVYTLPSMFQGEIAIQFKLRGRCVLYSNSGQARELAERLVDKRRAPAALAVSADAANERASAAAWLVAAD